MLLSAFPDDMFRRLPNEPFHYGDFPDLSAAVEYFRNLIGEQEWRTRREAAAWRFYETLVGKVASVADDGRHYRLADLFAWYLFLGEALTDHPQNYEVFYGSRVVPILATIGRNLELSKAIGGFDERARRIVGPERSQPNGGLFELLVALAYARDGAEVSFRPETPGIARSHDIDVVVRGTAWAVECKRMEAGEYAERERLRKLELWQPAARVLVSTGRNIYVRVDFLTELAEVPDRYLSDHAIEFLKSSRENSLWLDNYAYGVIGELDLNPLQTALKDGYLLYPGPIYHKLLTGEYIRYDNLNIVHKVKFARNPHFVDEVDQAVVLRTRSLSELSIEKKARDIRKKLSEANDQLPGDRPGVIHLGIEALNEDAIERRRYEKIMDTISTFDPRGKPLSYIYWHYFAPEATPEEVWAIDETFLWRGMSGIRRPLSLMSLVRPSGIQGRGGMHWDGTHSDTSRW